MGDFLPRKARPRCRRWHFLGGKLKWTNGHSCRFLGVSPWDVGQLDPLRRSPLAPPDRFRPLAFDRSCLCPIRGRRRSAWCGVFPGVIATLGAETLTPVPAEGEGATASNGTNVVQGQQRRYLGAIPLQPLHLANYRFRLAQREHFGEA
jgi:hypothetical protein